MRLGLSLLAISLLAACASQPVPQVSYETAHENYMQAEFKLAEQQLKPLAKAGDLRAERDLGLIYLTGGDGVKYDQAAGMTYLDAAARGGDALAQDKLGDRYAEASPPDYAQAHEWYEKAAAQGFARAEYVLGWSYLYGRGVPQDYAAALSWFNKSADAGDSDALTGLSAMYYFGYGVAKDPAHAMDLTRQAAKLGNRQANLYFGHCYRYGGCGFAVDDATARGYYEQASEGVMRSSGELAAVMKEIIDSHKIYPNEAVTAKQAGMTTVEFDCPDRQPENVKVKQSSGYRLLDAAAVQAVLDSYIPDRIPALKGLKHFQVEVKFVYDLPPQPAPAASTAVPPAAH